MLLWLLVVGTISIPVLMTMMTGRGSLFFPRSAGCLNVKFGVGQPATAGRKADLKASFGGLLAARAAVKKLIRPRKGVQPIT